MMDRKTKLIEIFRDTQKFYRDNEILAAAVARGRTETRLYRPEDYPQLPVVVSKEQTPQMLKDLQELADDTNASFSQQAAAHQMLQDIRSGELPIVPPRAGEIRVSNTRTFKSAMLLQKEFPGKKIAVLNFASATRPGGGVKGGAGAQEESLCRCSTLFPTIDRRWLWKEFYDVNRAARNVIHTDACIYSPGVVICKTDEDYPKRMEPEDFVTVDVISCAAPNLRRVPANWQNPETGRPVRMDPQQMFAVHVQRAKHILHVAAANGADIVVLGAFGCGAFRNDPDIVAKAYRTALNHYAMRFDLVEFAIYSRDYELDNYLLFCNCFPDAPHQEIEDWKELMELKEWESDGVLH